jgi:hypothetical protein
MTFAGAPRKLAALGGRRCLVISRLAPGRSFSFRLVLRVDADAPPGTADNVAEETPVQPPGLPAPPTAGLPGRGGVAGESDRAGAAVKVRPRRSSRPLAPPPVTG